MGLPQPAQHRGPELLLANQGGCAGGLDGRSDRRALLDGDQHHDDVGMTVRDVARGLDAVHPGHAHVEKHELRLELLDRIERLLARAGAADPAEARSGSHHITSHLEEDDLVVDA